MGDPASRDALSAALGAYPGSRSSQARVFEECSESRPNPSDGTEPRIEPRPSAPSTFMRPFAHGIVPIVISP